MASCKVTILVESILVFSNGDEPGSKPNHAGGQKNNAITATLDYPRGGRQQIVSVIQADLQDDAPYVFDTADFYGPDGDGVNAPGLFKDEVIEEECPLILQVTSNDSASHLSQVLGRVLTNLLGAAVFIVPGGQFVGAAVEFAAESLGDYISGESKGSVSIIGGAHVMLKGSELLTAPNPLRMTLPLIAPKTIRRGWLADPAQAQAQPAAADANAAQPDETLLTAGQPNGRITLRIYASPA
jgi:hypothetical protein